MLMRNGIVRPVVVDAQGSTKARPLLHAERAGNMSRRYDHPMARIEVDFPIAFRVFPLVGNFRPALGFQLVAKHEFNSAF